MQAYPPPPSTPQQLLDFEDQLEALFSAMISGDSFVASSSVQVNTSRETDYKSTPRVDLQAVVGQNMDYLSFVLQGNPQRQTPMAYTADLVMKLTTTRQVDTGNLHGQLRGRLRFIFSAPANLLAAQATFPLLHLMEVLPGMTIPALNDEKDQDTSAMNFRVKFAINDWAWPILISQPASAAVAHPAPASFSFGYLIGQKPTVFQWQVSSNGGATWAATADGSTYQGSQADTLRVLVSTGLNANQYRCMMTNFYGQTVTTAAATLTVS